jgi:hypothetical protein
MDALFSQIGAFLMANGAGGIIALLAIMALVNERKERKDERKDYDAEIKAKDEAHIATLNSWRADTQVQNDKISALAEKVIITVESVKRGQ